MPVRSCWWALMLLALLVATATASAQIAASATLSPPETETFPRLSAYLDVHDAQGEFLHGLQAEQVRLLENGVPLPLAALEELRPGAQVVIALNPGEPFSIRNSQGISRYDFIVGALLNWAQSRRGSSLDDLSLLAAAGPELTHFSDSFELVSALQSYQPGLEDANPGLEILLRAIDIAADPTPRPGMERLVLLVLPPLQGDITFNLQELMARATTAHVRLFIWMVASADIFESQPALLLADLAQQTGGQFFAFSGEEAIPDLESYIEPLRSIYSFLYDSRITQGGIQELSAEIELEGGVIAAPPVTFEFDLQPPNPAFISPVMEIARLLPAGLRPGFWEEADPSLLEPQVHIVQVLVDFPDGRSRPLQRTALFVDGVLVQENTAAPFENFTWDLKAYTTSGQHVLQVEAVDDLGLKGQSIQVPVMVAVSLPGPNPFSALAQRWPAVLGLAVLLLAALALLALVLTGRIRPHLAFLGLRRVRRAASASVPAPRQEPKRSERLSGWVNRLQWPQRRLHPNAYAYLTALPDSGDTPGTAPIAITADEMTFGLDPSLASFVLDDASVEGLHARLVRREDGVFWLVDQDSVAGTWINYAEIPKEGAEVEHGDLIHIGRVGLRFTLRQPQHTRKPTIEREEVQA